MAWILCRPMDCIHWELAWNSGEAGVFFLLYDICHFWLQASPLCLWLFLHFCLVRIWDQAPQGLTLYPHGDLRNLWMSRCHHGSQKVFALGKKLIRNKIYFQYFLMTCYVHLQVCCMAINVFAATQREIGILFPGMEPHIDFTSLGAFVCSLSFRSVSHIVSAVCLFANLSLCRCKDSDSWVWVEETTAIMFCLGLCRVPGLGQSALSPVAGSAGSWTIDSCCPLLETPLIVNSVHYATIKLFNPTPFTLQVRLAESDWSPCWALLWCDEKCGWGWLLLFALWSCASACYVEFWGVVAWAASSWESCFECAVACDQNLADIFS